MEFPSPTTGPIAALHASHDGFVIRKVVHANGGLMPTVREVVQILKSEGIPASASTVQRDHQAMALRNPRARKARRG